MNEDRIALLCLVDQQAIDDLFFGQEYGVVDDWVMWTHRIGSASIEWIRTQLDMWGQLNLYTYVKTEANEEGVSFRAQFDDFKELDGSESYRNLQCYVEFRVTTFETLKPPLNLEDLTNAITGNPIDTPSQLRRSYRYIIDPAYVETEIRKGSVIKRRRQPKSISSVEASYVMRTSKQIIKVFRHHEQLAAEFSVWLKLNGISAPELERNFIDVSFEHSSITYMIEIKTTKGVSTRLAIRDAVGQVLEYNYYYNDTPADCWIILLDSKPNTADLQYIETLREKLSIPLILCWKDISGFAFSINPEFLS